MFLDKMITTTRKLIYCCCVVVVAATAVVADVDGEGDATGTAAAVRRRPPWTPERYPNLNDWVGRKLCRTTQSSARLCDPDEVLTRQERETLSEQLATIERQGPQLRLSCEGDSNKDSDEGYLAAGNLQVAVALVREVSIYGDDSSL